MKKHRIIIDIDEENKSSVILEKETPFNKLAYACATLIGIISRETKMTFEDVAKQLSDNVDHKVLNRIQHFDFNELN